jgi:PAS domain S-box-containing protein
MGIATTSGVRVSFRTRIFSILIFPILVISVAYTFHYVHHERDFQTERLVMEGDLLARLLAHNSQLAVFAEQTSILEQMADGMLLHDNVISAAIFSADGKILTVRKRRGREAAASISDDASRHDRVVARLQSGAATVHVDRADRIDFFAPIMAETAYASPESLYFDGSSSSSTGNGRRLNGLVMIVLDKKDLDARLHALLVTSLGMTALLLLSASCCAYVVARGVTRPLNSLMKGVKNLEQGDLSGRIAVEAEDEMGMVSRAFNAMAEVLERREADKRKLEDQLRLAREQEAKEEWERTFDTIPDLLAILDREQRIVRVNGAMADHLGMGKEDVIGKSLYDLLGAEKPSGFPHSTVFPAVGAVGSAEFCIERSQRFYFVTISPLMKSEETVIGFVCVAHDITERKEAEEALRNSEEEFRALFETSRDAIMILGRKGFVDCNKAALDTFGYASKDLLAKQPAELSPPQQPDGRNSHAAVNERIEAAYAEGYQFFEWQFWRSDEIPFPAEVLLNRFELHGKTVLQAVIRDVTERKKLKEQLWHSQKMEAIGQLAGGVAHDFNNILTAIIGFANLVEMRMDGHDPSMPYLEQILAAADRATHLTQGLLAFSRTQVINTQPVDLNSIVTNVEKLLKRLISEEIELHISLAGQDLVVMADPGQIDQVLMNLATNARDAMPDGGTLIIETGSFEMGGDYIKTHGFGGRGPYAMVVVRDSGTGMDEATRARIFEPFFTTKEVGKGTGLGLAIVYGIVKQHNGFINAYSEPGMGTTFRIYLPLLQEEKASIDSVEESPDITGGTETLLVVEDNPEVRKLNKALLEAYGYRLIEAVDGLDAVQKFAEHRDEIRLVIMDVVMPKMNGKEAFAEMARLWPGVKVLFVSGYTPDVVQKKGIPMNESNFIPKPSSPQALLRKIREILSD